MDKIDLDDNKKSIEDIIASTQSRMVNNQKQLDEMNKMIANNQKMLDENQKRLDDLEIKFNKIKWLYKYDSDSDDFEEECDHNWVDDHVDNGPYELCIPITYCSKCEMTKNVK